MSGFVYFMRPVAMLGPIKIGHSHGPAARLEDVNRYSPYPLELAATVAGDQDLERRIQNRFHEAHFHCEWFHPFRPLLDAIEALQDGKPLEEAIDFTEPGRSVLGLIQRASRRRNGTEGVYRGPARKPETRAA